MTSQVNEFSQIVEQYVALRHPIHLYQLEDGSWFVKFPDLPGCMTDADRWEDLPQRIHEAKSLWIEGVLERGDEIPSPSNPY